MDRERRPHGFWDLKLSPGGQVDAEFAAQYRQLQAAAAGEPLTLSTLQALGQDPILAEAWRIQQRLAQLLAAAFEGRVDPEAEPAVFQQRLAEAAGALDFESLKTRLTDLRAQARRAFEQAVPAGRDGESPDPRSTS
jgi:glutamate-ammonia-ligase adenylyltransferase